MSCIFCSIIKGDIPCYKIYEDENVLAFLDIANDVEGHTLVVPKEHVADMNECGEKLFATVMAAAKKLVDHFISLGYGGANVIINCKPAAGQEVGHLHVHVLPRKEGDGARVKIEHENKNANLEEIAKKLRLN